MGILALPNFTEAEQGRALSLVRGMLPEDAAVLLMCLTGSRAYGWGGMVYDRDVRGVYVARIPYWDNCHFGRQGYDITMEEVQHFLRDLRWRWVLFEDLSLPFYVHPRFDFKGFQALCCKDHVRGQLYTIRLELKRFRERHQIRKALHCYRQLMVPIHFLETGQIEIQVLRLNERFGMEMLPLLCERYLARDFRELEWHRVVDELGRLERRLYLSLEENETEFDEVGFERWKADLEDALYN